MKRYGLAPGRIENGIEQKPDGTHLADAKMIVILDDQKPRLFCDILVSTSGMPTTETKLPTADPTMEMGKSPEGKSWSCVAAGAWRSPFCVSKMIAITPADVLR
ncbi:MAG TPA: hypothetical protein VMO00_01425 [Methylomirabilota bacterium]|nr:hypothetical protein [Methylomirabilota bacterium]